MKMSVAMCTYNGSAFLSEQLESIAAQTRMPDELVICDDCSQDSTVEIIRHFAATSPFPVRLYINQNNLRSTKNFEQAISLCSGDIIALSDQDDVWMPEKFQVFQKIFDEKPDIGIVFCDATLVDEKLDSLKLRLWQVVGFNQKRQQGFRGKSSLKSLLKRPAVTGCTMAFRAQYKDLVLPIPKDIPNLIHDYWISLLISSVSFLEPVPQALIKYRQHTSQQIGAKVEVEQTLTEKARKKYSYDEECARLKVLREALLLHSNVYDLKEALEIVDARLKHYSHRLEMQNGGLKKLQLIIRELLTFRYSSYSNGLKSAVKDLVSA